MDPLVEKVIAARKAAEAAYAIPESGPASEEQQAEILIAQVQAVVQNALAQVPAPQAPPVPVEPAPEPEFASEPTPESAPSPEPTEEAK